MKRKFTFKINEFYHIYNRGVDKREIFTDETDCLRFLDGLVFFNQINNIGSLLENSYRDKNIQSMPIVRIHAYNLLPNHFHLVLEQLEDNGISIFMHRLCTGYSKYFNDKYNRSGSLFQGRFKAQHIDRENYMDYVLAYVHQNHNVHQLGSRASKWKPKSSIKELEFGNARNGHQICSDRFIYNHCSSIKDYSNYSLSLLGECIKQRNAYKDSKYKQGLAYFLNE
ncbi:MAG: transposase [Patescibacteria group bacterium]